MLASAALVLSVALAAVATPVTTTVTISPSTTTSAPSSSPTSDPAEVHFIPYKYEGCRQTQNPKDQTGQATSYNVTTGHCFAPGYIFTSYFQQANHLAATGPCSLSIFPEANCTGTGVGAKLAEEPTCMADMSTAGQSFRLDCGP
ncbi:hypothetical protein CONPUDRAFT_166004 [Coniophora puteana RWD-64-598 SS2]|uniref:Uncharacterized protein n=1 Tax=Coniophora puteana (strain RWD-64-598) TaxID=741705 RepID=A0A5M3MN85_CONPW|nr:uncharacterized protein CONPUDRAFT_166004 [Coniophora puteana RWD-64-598 SS2]EIW80496.1 hypothetical protein CONPUDRAFT_166004 [Coniophora puteana RWD-64-598 SS2]